MGIFLDRALLQHSGGKEKLLTSQYNLCRLFGGGAGTFPIRRVLKKPNLSPLSPRVIYYIKGLFVYLRGSLKWASF